MGLIPNNLTDCLMNGYYNYECIFELAFRQRNSSICSLMERDEWRIECAMRVEQNVRICEDETGFLKDLCKLEYIRLKVKK